MILTQTWKMKTVQKISKRTAFFLKRKVTDANIMCNTYLLQQLKTSSTSASHPDWNSQTFSYTRCNEVRSVWLNSLNHKPNGKMFWTQFNLWLALSMMHCPRKASHYWIHFTIRQWWMNMPRCEWLKNDMLNKACLLALFFLKRVWNCAFLNDKILDSLKSRCNT